jgi:hypothetical protein
MAALALLVPVATPVVLVVGPLLSLLPLLPVLVAPVPLVSLVRPLSDDIRLEFLLMMAAHALAWLPPGWSW